jgi:hypothetical protein
MPTMATTRKSVADLTPEMMLIRELDTLQELSDAERDTYLGSSWFDDVSDMYNLTPSMANTPSWRPSINVPQMQVLALQESTDLASNITKVYITGPDGKRDKAREDAMMAAWRVGFFNLHTMYSTIWAMLSGTGFLQVGFDPLARDGFPKVSVKWRNPSSVHPDPAASSEADWYYVMVTERLWPDEIKRRFPAAAHRGVAAAAASPIRTSDAGSSNFSGSRMQMPPGPMSASGRVSGQTGPGPSDGRLQVRYSFIWDSNVRETAKSSAGSAVKTDKVLPAKWELLYPNGRYIVDVENYGVMFDGDNPHPMGDFPLTRVLGLPALTSFWGVPPTRYTKDLQDLAVRMLKQNFENAVRVNNVQYFLDENSGLTTDDFGGLPGEIRVISSNGKKPETLSPPAFPAHFMEYPKFLLALQKELWGFSPQREGQSGAGNVGPELFESAVAQSQSLTRLRSMMLASSMQRLAEQVFYMMAKYQGEGRFPSFESGFKLTDWKKIEPGQAKDFKVYLDPASVTPMSANALRSLVPKLRQLQMLDTRSGLDMLGIPGAGEIAENLEVEKALEALARLKKK